MSALLPSWPPIAREILVDAARHYYQQMKQPWPVPDVLMAEAIGWANGQLGDRQTEIYEEASTRWIDRWERGQLDDEMRHAIEETYRRLSRAERGIRGAPARKKTKAQLDRDIAEALGERER